MTEKRTHDRGLPRGRVLLAAIGLLVLLDVAAPAWAWDTTQRVSVGPRGRQADGNSFDAALSADGRFVAFRSEATNLVLDDTNDVLDVVVRDRELGTTERVSVGPRG